MGFGGGDWCWGQGKGCGKGGSGRSPEAKVFQAFGANERCELAGCSGILVSQGEVLGAALLVSVGGKSRISDKVSGWQLWAPRRPAGPVQRVACQWLSPLGLNEGEKDGYCRDARAAVRQPLSECRK